MMIHRQQQNLEYYWTTFPNVQNKIQISMIAGAVAALLLPTKVPTYFYGNDESESKTSQK